MTWRQASAVGADGSRRSWDGGWSEEDREITGHGDLEFAEVGNIQVGKDPRGVVVVCFGRGELGDCGGFGVEVLGGDCDGPEDGGGTVRHEFGTP
jgi:hypothetical protein